MPAVVRSRGLAVLAVLLAALAFAIGGQRMPAVVPATAPAPEVSGARAMALLQRLAAAPRPCGDAARATKPEHEAAQALLVAEIEAAGYAVERHRGVLGVPLVNLTVAIPGSAPTGTVLLLAHYDTVARSPGAGDDGIGVVSWVEAMRALAASGWRPTNDVLLLLSDGEESGMLGAMHFARTDRRVAKVKTVVNLEAIGNGGPAYLFELGPHNGPRVRLFADAVARPAGSSFAEAVYHLLPNDTDLSVFLKRGTQGFNLALTRGSCAYHAPHDTPANLDPRSVQHMADCAAALARRLGDADLGALRGDDVTFFDAGGVGMVVYPRSWDGWLAAVAVVFAIGAWAQRRAAWRALVLGCAGHVAGVAAAAALAVGGAWACMRLAAWLAPHRGWVAGNTMSAALLFAGAVAFAVAAATWRAAAAADPERADLRAAAGTLLWGLTGVAASAWLPGTSFALSWPSLAIGGALLLPSRWRASWPAQLVPFVFVLWLGLPIVHLLVQLMAPEPLVALGIAAAASASAARLLAVPLAALAAQPPLRRSLWLVATLALLACVVVARGLGWRCGALWP
jgi:hypothetical protein